MTDIVILIILLGSIVFSMIISYFLGLIHGASKLSIEIYSCKEDDDEEGENE